MRFAVLFTIALTFSFSLHANDFEKLKEAVDAGVERVREVLADKTIDVTARDINNQRQTILHYAAKTAEDPQIIGVLLDDGRIKKNTRLTWSGKTAFHLAAERKEITVYDGDHSYVISFEGIVEKFLADRGVAVNASDRWGRTPLYYVKNLKIMEVFLAEERVDIDARDLKEQTPLYGVIRYGTPAAAIRLIQADPLIITTDNDGITLFHEAARFGRLSILKTLIQSIPENKITEMLNAQDIRGETALYKVVDRDYRSPVDYNLPNAMGTRPVEFLTSWNRLIKDQILPEAMGLATARFLIESGADPNVPNKAKSVPLHVSAFKRYSEFQTILLEGGSEPNKQNYRGETPLHELVTSPENAEMIIELLEREADAGIPNDRGYTPLMDFVSFMGEDSEQNRNVVRALMRGLRFDLKAHPLDIPNHRGETVEDVAGRKGYLKTQELLAEGKTLGCFY